MDLDVVIYVDYGLLGSDGKQLMFEALRLGKTELTLDCDTLVFVGARLPDDALYLELQGQLPEGLVYLAGDALVPGIIQAAVFSGHKVARKILAEGNGKKGGFRLEQPDFG